jgi:uncharacterized repeat protein (TIGR03803 family)
MKISIHGCLAVLAILFNLFHVEAATVFPIATNPAVVESSGGIATCGTNYYVIMVNGTNLVGQLVSTNGTLIGGQTNIGVNPGFPPAAALAFGQTNYLVAWSDTSMSSGVDMFGQFISRSGAKVGAEFNLLSSQGSFGFQSVRALASDGTNFLTVWQDGNNRNLYGQLIAPSGSLSGSSFLINASPVTGSQDGKDAAIAFGKTNYLVAWMSGDGTTGGDTNFTYAELISKSGIAGSAFQISTTSSTDFNPLAVAFDGANFFVVWPWDPPPETFQTVTNWDLRGRLVSQTGTFPGNELDLVGNPGSEIFPALAFDGANYLLAWGETHYNSDLSFNPTNSNIYFQFFDRSGSAVGSQFTAFTPESTNTPFLPWRGLVFDGSRYAAAGSLGTIATSGGHITGFPSGEVFGAFISASTLQFTANPTNGLAPLTVQFNSPGVDSSGNSIVSWSWNFGDGATSTLQNPTHTYTIVGTFAPTLVATNNLSDIVLGTGPTISVPIPVVQTFTALYSSDTGVAFNPYAGLTLSGNTLFGTASSGGTNGGGSVFAIYTNGLGFTNLYSFNGDDGWTPFAGLVLSGGSLYGTTFQGGTNGSGGVFRVNPDGSSFTNLHAFAVTSTNSSGDYTNSDGANPYAGLILSGNMLYGTTEAGGTNGKGTVFKVKTDGSGYTVLHAFTPTSTNSLGLNTNSDGASPEAGLTLSGNMLYGAAAIGGSFGLGTVFAINTNGSGFTNIHSFNGYDPSDAAFPSANLLISGNTLFGTAVGGGPDGNGSVFAMNTNGTGFTNLYSFSALGGSGPYTNSDGASPYCSLILSGNLLYGTASGGGSSGNGTVFAVTTNGTGFTTLYAFSATDAFGVNTDGANSQAGLILLGNNLYGTAPNGGAKGYGTVFRLTLGLVTIGPPQLTILHAGTNVILTWPTNATGFTLQSASAVTGTFTNIPSATSPYTDPIPGPQKFYRLSQ